MIVLANNIKIPANSFNVFALSGTLPLSGAPLTFNNANIPNKVLGKKVLVKSVKSYFSVAKNLPGDAENVTYVATKVITNGLGEISGYEIAPSNRIIPKDAICWKGNITAPRILINNKDILFNFALTHPMVDLDNMYLLIDDPIQLVQVFVTDFTLPIDATGSSTVSKINVFIELGVYIL